MSTPPPVWPPQPGVPSPYGAPPPRGGSKTLFVILSIVIVLVALGCLVFFGVVHAPHVPVPAGGH